MDVLGHILGPGAGAAVVGLLWTMQHVIRRRSDSSAMLDEAAAFGFKTLASQVERLTARCEELNDQIAAEREQREYWQRRFQEELAAHASTRQAAEQLKREWEADKARPTIRSERPGPFSQRKA